MLAMLLHLWTWTLAMLPFMCQKLSISKNKCEHHLVITNHHQTQYQDDSSVPMLSIPNGTWLSSGKFFLMCSQYWCNNNLFSPHFVSLKFKGNWYLLMESKMEKLYCLRNNFSECLLLTDTITISRSFLIEVN